MMWPLIWQVLACGGTESACEQVCRTLVMDCEFAAYPTLESCQEGCLYDEEQGADIEAEAVCLQEASCDPIATVACAREHNPE